MRQVYRFLAYLVMVLAGLGVIASFFLSAASLAGNPNLQKTAFRFLFPGIFIVWVPTILLANLMIGDFKQREFWKAALRGCRPWMKTALWVIVAIVFIEFFSPFAWGSNPGAFPAGFLIFPSSFYAIAFCIAYSFLHVENFDAGRRCLNGHRVSPVAKFCEECGAPAAPDEMQVLGPRI
jgi:hypothetical protein